MSEAEMRRCTIDLILWTNPDKLKCIWAFVSRYLSDETVGIHADDAYLVGHADFLKNKSCKAERRAAV